MSGISVFSEQKDTEFERLQVNYWVYKCEKKMLSLAKTKFKKYLDVGIELKGGGKTNISIYFPCIFREESFSCIGEALKDKKLADVLFNDSCEVTEEGEQLHSFFIKTSKANKKSIKVATFQDKSTIRLSPVRNKGTLVTIPIPDSDDTTHRYFRVRLDLASLDKAFSQETQPLGSWLQSIRTKNREIDFRVNSIRNIPQMLLDDENKNLASFPIIHFFYITSSDESILFQNNKVTSARFLETGVWDNYFGNELNARDRICAHHWKFDDEEEVSLFFRANFASTNLSTIIFYILIASIFAFILNFLSSVAFQKFSTSSLAKRLFQNSSITSEVLESSADDDFPRLKNRDVSEIEIADSEINEEGR